MRRPAATPRLREPSGFTLVELLLVAAVIAVLAAAVVPALTVLLGRQEGMDQHAVVRNFLTAQRQEAIESGNVRWLRWEAGGHHLIAGVDGQPADDEIGLADEVELQSDVAEGLPDRTFELLTDTTLDRAAWSQEVLFYPDGRSNDAEIAFTLRSRPFVVTVDAWSGAIE